MILSTLLLMGFAQTPSAPDWLVIGSHREAVMAVDRASLIRTGDKVSVTVLMGMFKAEPAQASSKMIQYYLSNETFDCTRRTRTEHEVRVYGPEDGQLGVSPPDPEPPVRPGSIYYESLTAVCDGGVSLQGDGYATPLDVISGESALRRSNGLD